MLVAPFHASHLTEMHSTLGTHVGLSPKFIQGARTTSVFYPEVT